MCGYVYVAVCVYGGLCMWPRCVWECVSVCGWIWAVVGGRLCVWIGVGRWVWVGVCMRVCGVRVYVCVW